MNGKSAIKSPLDRYLSRLGILLVAGILLIALIVSAHVPVRDFLSTFGTMEQSPARGILTIIILAPWAFVGFEVVSLETAHFSFSVNKVWKLIAAVPTFYVLKDTLGTAGIILAIGFAFSKSIVDQMQGEIKVNTTPGEGTEMILHLKLKGAEASEVKDRESKEESLQDSSGIKEKEPEPVNYSEKRLLVVEDNAINMEIAVMILAQAGFMIETVENGQAAVDKVLAADPDWYDAILMDIQMPVMDGYTATRIIRALSDPVLSKSL